MKKIKYDPEDWEVLLDLIAGVVWLIEADTNATNDWEIKKISGIVKNLAALSAKDDLTLAISKEIGDWAFSSFGSASKVALYKSNRFIHKHVKSCSAILRKQSTYKEIDNFSRFVYNLAFKLANATGHGQIGFGAKVDVQEAEVLICLKSELSHL